MSFSGYSKNLPPGLEEVTFPFWVDFLLARIADFINWCGYYNIKCPEAEKVFSIGQSTQVLLKWPGAQGKENRVKNFTEAAFPYMKVPVRPDNIEWIKIHEMLHNYDRQITPQTTENDLLAAITADFDQREIIHPVTGEKWVFGKKTEAFATDLEEAVDEEDPDTEKKQPTDKTQSNNKKGEIGEKKEEGDTPTSNEEHHQSRKLLEHDSSEEQPEEAGHREQKELEGNIEDIKHGAGEDQTGTGINWPGHRYTGPGNPLPHGAPRNEIDLSAAKHDIRYKQYSRYGHWPYIWAPYIDKKMQEDIREIVKKGLGLEGKLLGNLISALWQAKYRLGAPIYEILKTILPPKSMPTKESVEKHLPKPLPIDPPQTSLPGASPPRTPDLGGETGMNEEPPAKRRMTEDRCDSTTRCETLDTQYEDSKMAGGVGGGGNQPKSSWIGGAFFTDTTVTTYGTRRCVLSSFPHNYCTTESGDHIPSLVVCTPWYYYDLNILSAHFSPSAWQTLLEEYDAFKPLKLEVKIKEIVVKDVNNMTGKQCCDTVSDNAMAAVLCFEDTHYELPYVLGGGQLTVPGHLPGQTYELPKYCYRTVGKPHSEMWSPIDGSKRAHLDMPFVQPTQNTEFFILENRHSTILHTGNEFFQTYDFPDLHFEQLTQYMWDARRLDNPMKGQRIQVMKNKPTEDKDQMFGIRASSYLVPWIVNSLNRPAMFLQGGRLKDGDYSIVGPGTREQATYHYFNDTPVVVERDIYKFTTSMLKRETQQPGPRTQETTVKTPDGTIIITTNSLAYGQVPENIDNIPSDHKAAFGVTGYRLAVAEQRGYSTPGMPSHIREILSTKTPKLLEKDQQEITFPNFEGSVSEKTSANLESQIWAYIPNTDNKHNCGTPPLSIWGMENPPPMVFLRLLPQLGPPEKSSCSGSKPSKKFLNQYCQFLLEYTVTWAVVRRKKHTPRWNPMPGVTIPTYNNDPVYILDQNGFYKLPETVWTAKQRVRARR
nr:capsid protein [Porcine parvovirus 5]